MNRRNNLTPSKALVLGRRNYASKLILYIDFILVDINFPIKWQNDHHFFLAANRSTDSRTSWFFSSLCVRYKPREVASRKKNILAGPFFTFSKSMFSWLLWLGLLSFLTFSINWHGTIAQSNASCLPFYNWVSRYTFISSLDFFTIYPLTDF